VDVVSDYVRLKKRGSNFIGLCPFHSEKTPSFNVNPSLNIFKCFGCGEGGDVFRFVERTEGLSFPEAVRLLADRAGVSLPEDDAPDESASETEAVHYALRFAARFFHDRLTKGEDAKDARDYLKSRGFTAASIRTFGIGYAPDAWDALLEAAVAAGIRPDFLEQAGLIVPRKDGSGHYDRYRHRLIFPIFSHVGKVLGFGGRILRAEDEPKYINSPETRVYNKSRVLYGLYHGKNALRSREEAILVEGYTDVVSLHQAGTHHVVASSGTALTVDQIALLGRYVKTLVLLYDADPAGLRATLRGIDLVLGAGLVPYAVQLPEGEDPDSFVQRHGSAAFEAYLKEHRVHFVDFVLQNAKAAGSMDSPEGQARVQRTILQSVSVIPDPLMQESYLRVAAERLGIPDMQLRPILEDLKAGDRRSRQRTAGRAVLRHTAGADPAVDPAAPTTSTDGSDTESPGIQPIPAEKLLHYLMLQGGMPLVEFILGHMAVEEFTSGPSRTLAQELVRQFEAGRIDRKALARGQAGTGVQQLVAEVLTQADEPSENWMRMKNVSVPSLIDHAQEAAASAMVIVKLRRVDAELRKVATKLYKAQQAGHDTRDLLKTQMQLQQLRRGIEDRAFID
jgi:DNA primase